ncbi:MAG TPA: PilZ domain-containing protein [Verrucomicrobiae bacterium]|nr:PilZ domain-containing protein [Verrucomicrobiae bacterium]
MSARKIGSIIAAHPKFMVAARQAHLELSADTVTIHKNGIEFRSPGPFNEWAEMTVSLSARDGAKLHCSGVVVSCSGNKHTGYRISMIFTNVSKQAQTRLNTMAHSDLGAS